MNTLDTCSSDTIYLKVFIFTLIQINSAYDTKFVKSGIVLIYIAVNKTHFMFRV